MTTPIARRTALAVLAAGLAASLSPAPASALESSTVRMGISINDATFLPVYLAQEQGLFAAEGLEVELIVFRGGSDLTRALIADAVDIALAAPTSVLSAIEAGQDVKIFFGGFNQTPFDWYAVPGIDSLEAAKGKRFGITRFGSSTDALTRYVLKAAGLDPQADVTIVQGGGSAERMTAMETGQLDASILAAPFTYVAEEKGYRLIVRQSDAMPDFPIQSLYAATSYLDSHPETIRAVLRGLIQGIRMARNDSERAVATMAARTGLEPRYAARAWEEMKDGWREDGRLSSEPGMAAFWEMAIASGSAEAVWPIERYWDDRFVSTIDSWKPE
jgi:NitT/TauT family transport system substrate-binding protein